MGGVYFMNLAAKNSYLAFGAQQPRQVIFWFPFSFSNIDNFDIIAWQ